MTLSIDLFYAVLSFLAFAISITLIIDGWKLVVLRKRILIFTLRISERISSLFYGKAKVSKWKNWHLTGRRPLIYGWICLLGGLFWLVYGIYLFFIFLEANSFY